MQYGQPSESAGICVSNRSQGVSSPAVFGGNETSAREESLSESCT